MFGSAHLVTFEIKLARLVKIQYKMLQFLIPSHR